MSPDSPIDLTRSAVLSLDVQRGVVTVYVKDEHYVERVATVLTRARQAGLPVIHAKVAFRPGVPEASPRNRFLSSVKNSVPHQRFFQGESGAIHPGIGPADSDLVVTKPRVGGFSGTDLDLLLRAQGIETLILFGIATSGAVLSTALQAADLDYRVVVLSDCCADLDPDMHSFLVKKILPQQAVVMTSSEFIT